MCLNQDNIFTEYMNIYSFNDLVMGTQIAQI